MTSLHALLLATVLSSSEPTPVQVAAVGSLEPALPAKEYLKLGKIRLGSAIEGADPRSRETVYREAEALFEHVIDRAPDSVAEDRAEAREFLRAIHAELPPNRVPEKATALRTLVLLVALEGETEKFDRKKFNDLSQKMKNKLDREEYQKVLNQCRTKVPLKTSFTTADETYVQRKVEEASKLLFECSRGRLLLDATIEKLPKRQVAALAHPGRQGFWALGSFQGLTGDRPETDLLAHVRGRRQALPDVLVVVPKYEKSEEELPGPADADEVAVRFPTFFGRMAVAHVRLSYPPAAPLTDGNTRIAPMEERIVARILRGLEPLILRNLANPNPEYRGDFISRRPNATDFLPSLDETLKVGYLEFPPGAPLLREVLSSYLSQGMVQGAVRLQREVDGRREPSLGRCSSPPPGSMLDGDLESAFRFLKVGDEVSVELARPMPVSELTFIADPKPPIPKEIEVTYGDEEQSWRFNWSLEEAPMRAQRLKLPAAVTLKTFSLRVVSVHPAGKPEDASGGGGFREVLFD